MSQFTHITNLVKKEKNLDDILPSDSEINSMKESEEGSLSLDIKLGGISSSSSLSWSDEYENDTTKVILQKLQRIDRVLKREEDIPFNFDREEIELWMHTFPNISIFDKPSCRNNNIDGCTSSSRCDKFSLMHNPRTPSVISNLELPYGRLLTQRSGSNRKRHLEDINNKNKNIFTIANKPKSLDTDKFLKIAPAKKHNERNLSTKSLKNDRIMKEYELPAKYDSLPFIEIDEIYNENRKPASSSKCKKYLNVGKSEILILPPIQGDKLRSISATPGQEKPSKMFLI